jgi:hypothetical protein
MRRARLGLITTGQGPRNEYVRYHRNLLWELGVDADIRILNAMDGLSREEMREIESKPGERYIGSHVHRPGARGDRMGPGWTEIGTDDLPLIPLFQNCLDSLEADEVDATILCCVEQYPIEAFNSTRPFIVPWLVVTEWVRTSTMYMENPRIGILIGGEKWVEQDTATWTSQSWMARLEVVIETRRGRLEEALASFREKRVDLVVGWGYGVGIAPEDPLDMLNSIYEALDVPYLTPHRLATMHARNLLIPSIDDRRVVGYVSNPPGASPET